MTRRIRTPTAIDLFAGCGAVSEGLKRAGFRVVAGVEIDPGRVRTYRLNHPGIPVLAKDIRRVSGAELLSAVHLRRGSLDLLAGCPPCQGFSRIRRRNSSRAVQDARNMLVGEFGRLARHLRPKAILLENVPGLEVDRLFRSLLSSLRLYGYSLAWAILDLAIFGVPQRRRRLVLIGLRGKKKPDLGNVRQGPSRTVRDAIGSLPYIPGRQRYLHFYPERRSRLILERIRCIPHNGGGRESLPHAMRLKCHVGASGFRDVYGRMSWDQPSPTITGGCNNPSKGRFLHPTKNRAITLLEAARLQTFPVSYRFSSDRGRYAIAEMIGEAVPPLFVRRIANYIRRELERRGTRR